uniref:Uncharacterized protein n=1 Tax=Arundo donax TaxID=35708 RepID=A0A0A8YH44_ARUDO
MNQQFLQETSSHLQPEEPRTPSLLRTNVKIADIFVKSKFRYLFLCKLHTISIGAVLDSGTTSYNETDLRPPH